MALSQVLPLPTRLTPGQRHVLERMAQGAELCHARPGGWVLGHNRVDGRIGWALVRCALLRTASWSRPDCTTYTINERGRQVLAALAAAPSP